MNRMTIDWNDDVRYNHCSRCLSKERCRSEEGCTESAAGSKKKLRDTARLELATFTSRVPERELLEG